MPFSPPKLPASSVYACKYIHAVRTLTYFGNEQHGQHDGADKEEAHGEHGRVCVLPGAEGEGADQHDDNHRRRCIDDDCNVLGVVKSLDCDLSSEDR